MKFSIPNMPVVVYVEFWDSIEWNEATTIKDENTAVIVLHKTDNLEDDLHHEVIHAVSHQLRRIWIEHTEDTEEIYCYTICYFYKKILKKIKSNVSYNKSLQSE